jgi:hypothetical protein
MRTIKPKHNLPECCQTLAQHSEYLTEYLKNERLRTVKYLSRNSIQGLIADRFDGWLVY